MSYLPKHSLYSCPYMLACVYPTTVAAEHLKRLSALLSNLTRIKLVCHGTEKTLVAMLSYF